MKRREGFTLVELVVVILILGILAAVALPRVVNTTGNATDNGLRQSLAVVRDAIDLYSAEHSGQLPGADGAEATFKTDLEPYLRTFPKAPVGAKNDQVRMQTSGAALTGDAAPTKGWAYDNQTGEFIVNTNAVSNDGTTQYDAF